MDIEERMANVKELYDAKQAERNGYVTKANDCLVELNKLEGQWNLLQDMAVPPAVQDATTIEAIPEKTKSTNKKG